MRDTVYFTLPRLGNKLVKQLFPNKIFLNKNDYHDPLKNIEELLFSL